MKTIEEIFTDTKAIFTAQAVEAMEQVMSKIYEDYLPHVESDTQFNQDTQISRWLERFFSDSLREDDIKIDLTRHGWDNEKARQKIYEANKDVVHTAIGKDLADKVDNLQAQLNDAYRRYL